MISTSTLDNSVDVLTADKTREPLFICAALLCVSSVLRRLLLLDFVLLSNRNDNIQLFRQQEGASARENSVAKKDMSEESRLYTEQQPS